MTTVLPADSERASFRSEIIGGPEVDALWESVHLLQEVFASSADCIKILSPEGRLLSMNRRGQGVMDIADFGDFAGRQWVDLWPEQTRPLMRAAMHEARQGGSGRFSGYCPTATGTVKFWDVVVTPIYGVCRNLVCLLAVSRDNTAQHRLIETLIDSARAS